MESSTDAELTDHNTEWHAIAAFLAYQWLARNIG